MGSGSSPPFWIGGLAASFAACFTHPLDLLKVRMQTADGSTNLAQTLRTTLIRSGPNGLYMGLSASLLRQMSYSLVRLGSYESLKAALSDGQTRPTLPQMILAAGIAGGLGGVVGNPADVLLVRMTSDSLKPDAEKYNYKNALRGLYLLARDEKLKGLAKGLAPNTARAVLMNVSQVASYDFFKAFFSDVWLKHAGSPIHDGLGLQTASSMAAGVVATTITSPVDVIKSRLMSSSTHESPISIFARSLQQDGISFMFRGWSAAFMRLGPNTVLLFLFLEHLKKMWTQSHP